jgi:tRNA1Val (adenine37-N6)-methyltransferase
VRRTRDALWRGQLGFWQPARGEGYRFNLDPVLLSGFARPAPHVIELGAGVGVLAVLLVASGRAERVTAVEIQPELAALCADNARDNGLATQISVVAADLRSLVPVRADAAVFNPPYFKAGDGRGAPERRRDAARHERHGTLADFVAFAVACVGAGRVAAVVPAARGEELEALLTEQGHGALRRRVVVAREGAPAERWLVEGAAPGDGAASLAIEAPLVVHAGDGREFTAEVKALLHEE